MQKHYTDYTSFQGTYNRKQISFQSIFTLPKVQAKVWCQRNDQNIRNPHCKACEVLMPEYRFRYLVCLSISFYIYEVYKYL